MSDMTETFRAMKEEHAALRGRRVLRAAATFPRARDLARRHRLSLRQCVPGVHYQLRVGDALYNLYPSTQRIHIDRRHRGPRLDLPRPWGLLCAVRAAVQAQEAKQ